MAAVVARGNRAKPSVERTRRAVAEFVARFRRAVAVTLTLVTPLGPALSAQSSPSAATLMPKSWLQLRGGTDNAGVLPGTLEATWQFKAERPVRGLSVAGGLVLIGTESADADAAPDAFAPDQRGFLIALDATTGAPLWTRALRSWVHGDPLRLVSSR